MTDTQKTEDKAAASGSPATAPRTTEEPRFLVEELIDNARGYLDVPSWDAAGALNGVRTKTLPLAEAKSLVKDFLKRPVEMDQSTTNEES